MTAGTGPTHPTPSRPTPPPRPHADALAALVAEAERQFSAQLHALTAAFLDGDYDEPTRRRLNRAANLTSCALNTLAHIDLPARRPPTRGPSVGLGSKAPARQGSDPRGVVHNPGGPVLPPDDSEGGRAGGGGPTTPGAVGEFSAGVATLGGRFVLPEPAGPPRFDEGVHRLVGRVGAR